MLFRDNADTFSLLSGSGLGGALTTTGASTSSSFAGRGDMPPPVVLGCSCKGCEAVY
ncbi:hypothetical protein [Flavobacterium beibuense]|uniref:hypothetical protein n=1 Tax=Flavobacterium beibuense TaxID=657326 RepID=UPI0018DC8CFA|nr:hypothetical protein [Flavobacterium beibuense]